MPPDKPLRLLRRYRAVSAIVPALLFLGQATPLYGQGPEIAKDRLEKIGDSISTALLNFDFKVYSHDDLVTGSAGGLAVTDDGVLIARNQHGKLYYFDRQTEAIFPIRLGLPENNFSDLPATAETGGEIRSQWVRYNDIDVISRNDEPTLVASFTYFNPDEQCYTNRLAAKVLEDGWDEPLSDRGEAPDRDGWQTVFETRPCLPFVDANPAFFGLQGGGRFVTDRYGIIYLTVGDFKFDGVSHVGPANPQKRDNDYGKIIRIDSKDWSASIFSIGHRNPQGIMIDDIGRIWSVEHGPRGGDELNLIRYGGNYGWPLVTLGVDYTDATNDAKAWPPNPAQGRHDGFIEPVFAWVRSAAVSNIAQISNIDPRWDGDFLVGSLGGQSLFRLRLSGERVVYAERIRIGLRIRYLAMGSGEIFVLFDTGHLATLKPRPTTDAALIEETSAVDAAAEESVVVTEGNGPPIAPAAEAATDKSLLVGFGCQECHSQPDVPSLEGVFGRAIASEPGVDYSKALKRVKGKWKRGKLRSFLAASQDFAPGTSMPAQDLSEQTIDQLIKELRQKSSATED